MVAELLSLAREVYYSGEIESWPPGGKHLEDWVNRWSQLRRHFLVRWEQMPGEARLWLAASVDLSNLTQSLLALGCLGRLEADRSEAFRLSISKDFRGCFEELMDLLSELEGGLPG